MANPLNQEERAQASDLAWECKRVSEQAAAFASFLQDTLPIECDTHQVRFIETNMGNVLGDLILETPIGRLCGRFRYLPTSHGITGVLEFFAVQRTLTGTIQLEFLHGMSFDGNGRVAYDDSLDSMDFLLSGSSLHIPTRTIAKILVTRQVQSLTKA